MTRILSSAIISLVLVLASSTTVGHGNGPHRQTLTGTWLVNGTPDPTAGVPDFVNVARMGSDGEVVNVDPLEGTAVGGWRRVGHADYAVTFSGFIVNGASVVRYVVNATVTVTGAHFNGPFRTEVLDLDGNSLFTFQGTVSAERQRVEPF